MSGADADISCLISDARAGNRESLERLLDAFRNYLALLARTWVDASLQGKADASDLVQETMLKAYQRFGQFNGQSEPELAVWLRRILARNLADSARRFKLSAARQVSREQSLDDVLDRSSRALNQFIGAAGSSPSQAAARREMCVVLADALAELQADHREVIVLRNLEELEWEAIARKMERSVGAVRMLWTRALKQLRPAIEAKL